MTKPIGFVEVKFRKEKVVKQVKCSLESESEVAQSCLTL